ncbi:MAG: cryptochrome/photolyase family protein [Candidatus Methylopumilus sp.]
MKRLVLILGDQLDINSSALADFDASTDEVIMIESQYESDYVWSHKAKIAIFLSAMRHFAQTLQAKKIPLTYIKESPLTIQEALRQQLIEKRITHLLCIEPGEWRLKLALEDLARELNVNLLMLDDDHFYCSNTEFRDWVADKKELRLEYFYRYMRKKHHVLMDGDSQPIGGQWNFDDQNRRPYSKNGPGLINEPLAFPADEITLEVFDFVVRQYPAHPGSLEHFVWPVTREQALLALDHFVNYRLASFGMYQDAMWKETPFGWHSILSSSLNLKLLNPREVIKKVLDAYQNNGLDLATVEGFIRQIIGWREFVRGIYYLDMPQMAQANFYQHQRALPNWYWTGETKMNCMKDTIGQTLKYGYAHHIQRLMITGNFALLAEILPQQVSEWYLAVYVDAIEWVELPNVVGMALFANGGRFTSKPYIASGAYVKRMSNYCDRCQYKPDIRYGEQACPMTTLYWNFLIKHSDALNQNPRTRLMTANLAKISTDDQGLIQHHAQTILADIDSI